MSAMWAMTSPETGRFSGIEELSDVSVMEDRFHQLRSQGQGYVEVRLQDMDFPQLTLSFRDDHAVVHLFSDAEKVSLLKGDGTVPPEAAVDVPIMDDLAEFTGDFVLSVDRAWALVRSFARTGVPAALGEWCEL